MDGDLTLPSILPYHRAAPIPEACSGAQAGNVRASIRSTGGGIGKSLATSKLHSAVRCPIASYHPSTSEAVRAGSGANCRFSVKSHSRSVADMITLAKLHLCPCIDFRQSKYREVLSSWQASGEVAVAEKMQHLQMSCVDLASKSPVRDPFAWFRPLAHPGTFTLRVQPQDPIRAKTIIPYRHLSAIVTFQ